MLLRIAIPMWASFGFYRGVDLQNAYYKMEYEFYERNKQDNVEPKYFYSRAIKTGLVGFLCYINPITLPFVLSKEMYRLEVNMRNLKGEKEKYEYKRLF